MEKGNTEGDLRGLQERRGRGKEGFALVWGASSTTTTTTIAEDRVAAMAISLAMNKNTMKVLVGSASVSE